ncbi:MAG: hypothetical protein ABIG95_01415, partial [Candidatus Woesearchaeota archaeon]
SSLKELADALRGMDDEIFTSHVNDAKNDVYSWIKANANYDELAEKAKGEHGKLQLIDLLDKVEKQKLVFLEKVENEGVTLEQVNAEIEELKANLAKGDLIVAKDGYKKIIEMYKELGNQDKALIHNSCIELHKRIVAMELFNGS